MADLLDDLYRQILLQHYRSPRRRGHIEHSTHHAEGANPLCGDDITLDLRVEDDAIADVAFDGRGCSISQASASMMADFVAGRPVAEALSTVGQFQEMMLTGEPPADDAFGDIEALVGVAKFPARVKCASLGWKTLEQALGADGAVAERVSSDERTTQ